MLSHEETVELHAKKHELVEADRFKDRNYVHYLIHRKAYEKAMEFTEDKKVLDLGCNTGYGSHIIHPSCREIVGVDVSEEAIRAARDSYGKEGIEFQVIDGKTLPFDDDSFDLVISFQVIEHIIKYEEYLNEIKRVLKSGGKVIFTTPNRLIRLYPGMKPWNEFHVKEYSPEELRELMNEYFSRSEIYGLFAPEPLYSMELSRVQRIRDRAKLKQDRRVNPVAKSLRLFLMNIKASVDKRLTKLDRDFQDKYSTKDFYYKTANLDDALDLMAICTNDKSVRA